MKEVTVWTPLFGMMKMELYMYLGGLWGGQLQRYRNNKALECANLPEGE